VTNEHSYQAYFLGAKDRIGEMRVIEAPDHISARAAAKVMLCQSEYTAVEVYEGWRLVWRAERETWAA
jgi:hypothetical protein